MGARYGEDTRKLPVGYKIIVIQKKNCFIPQKRADNETNYTTVFIKFTYWKGSRGGEGSAGFGEDTKKNAGGIKKTIVISMKSYFVLAREGKMRQRITRQPLS